jgi:hypothetical protein
MKLANGQTQPPVMFSKQGPLRDAPQIGAFICYWHENRRAESGEVPEYLAD